MPNALRPPLPAGFYLHGFKSFVVTPAVIPLRPLTLIYGENSSGKSSLLQGLWLIGAVLKNDGTLSWRPQSTRMCGVDLGPMANFFGTAVAGRVFNRNEDRVTTGFYLGLEDLAPGWVPSEAWDAVRDYWDGQDQNRPWPIPIQNSNSPEVREPACHVRNGAWLFLEITAPEEGELTLSGLSLRTPFFHLELQGQDGQFSMTGAETWVEPMDSFGQDVDLSVQLVLEGGLLRVLDNQAESASHSSEAHAPCRAWCVDLLNLFGEVLANLFLDPLHIGAQRRIPRLGILDDGAWTPNRDESRLWELLFKDGEELKWMNDDLAELGVPYALRRGPMTTGTHLNAWVDEWFSEDPDLEDQVGKRWRDLLDRKLAGYQNVGIPRAYLKELAAAASAKIERRPDLQRWADLMAYLADRFVQEGIQVQDLAYETEVDLQNVGRGLLSLLYAHLFAYYGETTLRAIEEPELHLHPKLQVAMGDLLIQAAHKGGICIAETHSEHLLLRLLRRVRETSQAGDDDRLKHPMAFRDLAVVHVGRSESPRVSDKYRIWHKPISQTTVIPVQSDGFIDSANWPGGFFEERLEAIGAKGGGL